MKAKMAQYIFMNKDCKFLSTSLSETHTGRKLKAEWVDKDRAEAFRTNNVKAELKMRYRNYHSDISGAVVAIFEAEVIRTVNILGGVS